MNASEAVRADRPSATEYRASGSPGSPGELGELGRQAGRGGQGWPGCALLLAVLCATALTQAPGLSAGPRLTLPPYIPIATRATESDIVIVGRIQAVKTRGLNSISKAANIRIQVLAVLKGKRPPKAFSVNFIVFPKSYENQLRKPPGPGKYFLFLKRRKIKDSRGRVGTVVVLYRPHPFSYVKYTEANRARIIAVLKKAR